MSLLGQTARYLLMTAFLITLIGSVGFYTLIHWKIRYEVDEILSAQVKQTALRLQKKPTSLFFDWDNNPQIKRVRTSIRPKFSDIIVLDSLDTNKPIPVRQLRQTVSVNGQIYLITIQQPYFEFDELSRQMSVGVIFGFLILMGLSVAIGVSLSRRLWSPFYATINRLGGVRLDGGPEPTFPQSGIREFGLLNRSLSELTQNLRRQFLLQKQFTENASHELQTPLAVASAELDFLLQSNHLTENDYAHLQRATDALERLSQLNRSLLLLIQVENNQFANDDAVEISELLNQYSDEYEPFFQHKNMALNRAITPNIDLRMNHQLAGVLIANLLKNAIRHGKTGGCVGIELTPEKLTICNTGDPLPFAANQLFNRFVKNPARPDSIGLGLALVRQICDRYGLPITYQYNIEKGIHEFRVGLGR
ncbi:sensor histidine kinase [Spirosoma pollinicola]|uniref:histidine kinase n=1 Tax=Spirosoma pollinicola TaxID=2057025 RepID=A0A2K8ZAK2_9BACT|nr:HAMP domain-containing sensor histidine kinase [Spirosoma pollinicola]AUD06903.1 sensor histidine kinase [Spirosoma pollinicola]